MADIQISPANYGGARHPGWYYNLIAHPECELHIGPRGGRFVAHEVEGGERDRLFGLAVDLYPGYGNYAQRTDGGVTSPLPFAVCPRSSPTLGPRIGRGSRDRRSSVPDVRDRAQAAEWLPLQIVGSAGPGASSVSVLRLSRVNTTRAGSA